MSGVKTPSNLPRMDVAYHHNDDDMYDSDSNSEEGLDSQDESGNQTSATGSHNHINVNDIMLPPLGDPTYSDSAAQEETADSYREGQHQQFSHFQEVIAETFGDLVADSDPKRNSTNALAEDSMCTGGGCGSSATGYGPPAAETTSTISTRENHSENVSACENMSTISTEISTDFVADGECGNTCVDSAWTETPSGGGWTEPPDGDGWSDTADGGEWSDVANGGGWSDTANRGDSAWSDKPNFNHNGGEWSDTANYNGGEWSDTDILDGGGRNGGAWHDDSETKARSQHEDNDQYNGECNDQYNDQYNGEYNDHFNSIQHDKDPQTSFLLKPSDPQASFLLKTSDPQASSHIESSPRKEHTSYEDSGPLYSYKDREHTSYADREHTSYKISTEMSCPRERAWLAVNVNSKWAGLPREIVFRIACFLRPRPPSILAFSQNFLSAGSRGGGPTGATSTVSRGNGTNSGKDLDSSHYSAN
jgi:hypothetical protein